ncbi:hypothetical protein SAMN06264364_1534 [Quadrisphaera granulorum]|uniref:Uncharacterized protein n=1 Tax=Quadrisphaera granulorum TaxID=317664 RepID=A0A315ZL53_9ACTN|nr:hypothetical protein BXY45_1534 [Quadrisphaera granulorum]SZE99149.1 hypothetical protein SAMN06264364_1534 [Quadrisphaera granulorum]
MVFMAKRDCSRSNPGNAINVCVMNCSYAARSAVATRA